MNKLRVLSGLMFLASAVLIYFSTWPETTRIVLAVVFLISGLVNLGLVFIMKKFFGDLYK